VWASVALAESHCSQRLAVPESGFGWAEMQLEMFGTAALAVLSE